MSTKLKIGFIPLIDAALLITARDEGFADAEGLDLELVRDVTWANLRDRLGVGQIDAAHMLAPAAIATSLGCHPHKVEIAAPICLNRNGNAITVSRPLFALLQAHMETTRPTPRESAQALARVVEDRRKTGARELVFGTTFPFSMHSILLNLWLAEAGLGWNDGLRAEVIPPQFMAQALEAGELDGFCAGAPWNALAAERRDGAILHLATDILPDAPEKVLAWRVSEFERRCEASDALVRALYAASAWCANATNRPRLARNLARPHILDAPAGLIDRLLAGHLAMGETMHERIEPTFVRLEPDVLRPRIADARFIFEQMVSSNMVENSPALLQAAEHVFRPDAFDRALRGNAKTEIASAT